MKKNQLPNGWYIIPFDDSIIKSKYRISKIQSKDYLERGKYPIIDQADSFIAGYTDLENDLYDGELPVIIFGDHTRRFKFVDFRFAAGADGTQILLTNREILVPKFLFYYLRSLNLPDAGYSRHYKFLRETKVVVPPLDDQKKIVSILEKAERAIQKRKEADELADKYLQSVFIEMFGDPVVNPKGWRTTQIGNISEVKTGGTPSREEANYWNGDISWIKTTEVKDEVILSSEEKITRKGLENSNATIFPINSILIAMYGQGKTRGKTAKLAIQASTNQACAAILPSDQYSTNYLWYLLRICYESLRNLGRGGNQPNLNLGMIKEYNIIFPHIEKQELFSNIVEKVEKLKQKQKQSTEELDTLFNSLMQKAFRGELTADENDFVDMSESSSEGFKKLIKSEFADKKFTFEELILTISKQYESIGYEEIKMALFGCLEKRKNGSKPFLLQVFDEEKERVCYKIN